VSRRSGQTQTALAVTPTASPTHALVTEVLHRFEVWTVLECHAVARAARAPHRDTRALHALLPDLNRQVLAPSDPTEWQRLEARLHHAINELSGNPPLAEVVDGICSGLQALHARQVRRPGTLWLLQCQHRTILSCIEAGQAEQGMRHTRAHLHLMRDQLVAALNAPGPRPL
jgi:DNA-binding GntR family transcriptional regulator